jgi:hypothetical protein
MNLRTCVVEVSERSVANLTSSRPKSGSMTVDDHRWRLHKTLATSGAACWWTKALDPRHRYALSVPRAKSELD